MLGILNMEPCVLGVCPTLGIYCANKKLDTSKSGTHTRSFGKPMYFWSGSKPFEHIPIYYAIMQEMSLNVTLVLVEIWERSLLYKVGSLSHYVRRVSCFCCTHPFSGC